MTPECQCLRCLRERDERIGSFPVEMCRMIVCPTCGCKRCPHASDHRYACTGSNRPNQPGSVYQYPDEAADAPAPGKE